MKDKFTYYYKKYNLHYLLIICSLYILKLVMYRLTSFINTPIHTINMKIDSYIPFCKYFIIFYFTYYWFTPLILYLTSYSNKRKFYKLTISTLITCVLSNIVFLTYQVKMIRPEIVGNDIFDLWVKSLYNTLDPTALNCFPSLHAVMGVITVIASYKNKTLPKWLQVTGIILGIGCAISTVLIKQHYFIDMIVGIILIIVIYSLVSLIENKLNNKKESQ